MDRIYLIGYMGSGKSTVSFLLSQKLKWQQIDIDDLIVSRSGHSIPEIFDIFGEEEFRKVEARSLLSTKHLTQSVIATGGGAPCFFDNISMMKSNGKVFYLRGDVSTLCDRILADTKNVRPIIKGKSKQELHSFVADHLKDRSQYYEQAHYQIDIRQHPSEIVHQIMTKLNQS